MKISFPQEPKCFCCLPFKIWNSCTLYFLERSLILKFWKWTAFILKLKNSVPKESQHLVPKIHPFLLLCPLSLWMESTISGSLEWNLNNLAFNLFLSCSLSHLWYPFHSHNFLGQGVIPDSTFSYSPYPIHQQILQNIVRIWPLFTPTTVTTMAQAIIVSLLVYCTGFLTGLLSPAFDLQLQSILNKADCDHGSPLLKTSNGFFAQKNLTILKDLASHFHHHTHKLWSHSLPLFPSWSLSLSSSHTSLLARSCSSLPTLYTRCSHYLECLYLDNASFLQVFRSEKLIFSVSFLWAILSEISPSFFYHFKSFFPVSFFSSISHNIYFIYLLVYWQFPQPWYKLHEAETCLLCSPYPEHTIEAQKILLNEWINEKTNKRMTPAWALTESFLVSCQ